MVMMMQLLCIR